MEFKSNTLIIEKIEKLIKETDGAIQKRLHLYHALGYVDCSLESNSISGQDYVKYSSQICRMINDPKYFD